MKRLLLAAALAALCLCAPEIYAASPSPSGSTIPIIDCSGNSWNFTGGVVQENGKAAVLCTCRLEYAVYHLAGSPPHRRPPRLPPAEPSQ